MSTYVAATDSALEWVEKLHQKDISKAMAGFFELRFTAGIPANLSMSYSSNLTMPPGRCYLEIYSLFAIYNSIQDFDQVVAPVQDESVKNFQVPYGLVGIPFLPLISCSAGTSPLGPIYHPVVHGTSVQGSRSRVFWEHLGIQEDCGKIRPRPHNVEWFYEPYDLVCCVSDLRLLPYARCQVRL